MANGLEAGTFDQEDMKIVDRYVEAVDRAEKRFIRPGNIDSPTPGESLMKKIEGERDIYVARGYEGLLKDKISRASEVIKEDHAARDNLRSAIKGLNGIKTERVKDLVAKLNEVQQRNVGKTATLAQAKQDIMKTMPTR